jgi:hypothetical protein
MTKRTGGIIMYKTKRTEGITQDHEDRLDYTGPRGEIGYKGSCGCWLGKSSRANKTGRINRTDKIRLNHRPCRFARIRINKQTRFSMINRTNNGSFTVPRA